MDSTERVGVDQRVDAPRPKGHCASVGGNGTHTVGDAIGSCPGPRRFGTFAHRVGDDHAAAGELRQMEPRPAGSRPEVEQEIARACLLYTSDAADELT